MTSITVFRVVKIQLVKLDEPYLWSSLVRAFVEMLTPCKITVTVDLTKWWMDGWMDGFDFCGFQGATRLISAMEIILALTTVV